MSALWKTDLNMRYELKIAFSLVFVQVLISEYNLKQGLYHSVYIYTNFSPLPKVWLKSYCWDLLLTSARVKKCETRVPDLWFSIHYSVQSHFICNNVSTAHKPALWKREWNNSGTNCAKTRVSRSGWGGLAPGQCSWWVQSHKYLKLIWKPYCNTLQ